MCEIHFSIKVNEVNEIFALILNEETESIN